jgi:hypothetical protein
MLIVRGTYNEQLVWYDTSWQEVTNPIKPYTL